MLPTWWSDSISARDSRVVEVASNDGYLLQYVKARGISCLGIEPTASTARAAREKGIETLEDFFGAELGASLAAAGKQADLMAANNVLAHVPDINDFVAASPICSSRTASRRSSFRICCG